MSNRATRSVLTMQPQSVWGVLAILNSSVRRRARFGPSWPGLYTGTKESSDIPRVKHRAIAGRFRMGLGAKTVELIPDFLAGTRLGTVWLQPSYLSLSTGLRLRYTGIGRTQSRQEQKRPH